MLMKNQAPPYFIGKEGRCFNILDNLNYFHLFREGTERTPKEVLALTKNYQSIINVGTDDNIYNLYMDNSVCHDRSKLKILFDNILIIGY